MSTRDYLSKIKGLLIPFRQQSNNNPVPRLLAEKLTAFGNLTTDEDYFEFFADALSFTEIGGFDRIGTFHALPGLEEILISAIDFINGSLEVKHQIIAALERFKVTLEKYDSQFLSDNRFRETPEKQNNLITYYLSTTRSYFTPSTRLTKLLSKKNERLPASDELAFIRNYFRQREALRFSEPLVEKLLRLIEKNEKFGNGEDKSEEFYETGSAIIFKLNERWRKICLVGYRGTRQAAEVSAPTKAKQITRSGKTAWAVAAAMSFLPASAIDNEDVLVALPRGAISDALRLCFSSRKYDWKTADQIGRISWFVTQGEIYYWRTKWRGKRRRKPPRRNSGGRRKNDDPSPAEILESESIWTDEINLQTEEGAAPDELEVSAETPVVEKSPRGSSSESKAFRLTHDEASWGRSRLTDETIGVVWAWLRNRAENYPENAKMQSALLFVELQLFFGFPPDSLLASLLEIGSAPTDETARFKFDPRKGVSAQDKQKVESDVMNIRRQLESALQNGVTQLRVKAANINGRNQHLAKAEKDLSLALAQAASNRNAVRNFSGGTIALFLLAIGIPLGGGTVKLAMAPPASVAVSANKTAPAPSTPPIIASNSLSTASETNTATNSSNLANLSNSQTIASLLEITNIDVNSLTETERQTKAEDYYKQGTNLTKAGNYTKAEKYYREAIRFDDFKAEYQHELGYALYRLKKYGDSIQSLQRAIKLGSTNKDTKKLLGSDYVETKNWNEAEKIFKEISQQDSGSFPAYYNLGIAAENTGNYQSAITALEKAVQLAPNNAKAHYELGRCYYKSDISYLAEEEYEVLSGLDEKLAAQLRQEIDGRK